MGSKDDVAIGHVGGDTGPLLDELQVTVLPMRIPVGVRLVQQEQGTFAARDADQAQGHQQLALPVREIGEAHVAAIVAASRDPQIHGTNQVGSISIASRA